MSQGRAGDSFHRPRAAMSELVGRSIQGGCEDCDAHQEIDQIAPGMYGLTVRHDVTCPAYRRILAARTEK